MDRMMHNDATKMSAWRHLQLSLWWPNLYLLDQVNNVRLNDMKNIKYWLLFQVHRTHWKSWLRKYKHPVKSHCLCVHSVFCTAHCALLFIFNPCMLFIFQAFIPKEVSACSLINKGPKQPVTPHVWFNTVFQPNLFPDESPGIFASSPDQIRDLLLTHQMSFTTTSRHISLENTTLYLDWKNGGQMNSENVSHYARKLIYLLLMGMKINTIIY